MVDIALLGNNAKSVDKEDRKALIEDCNSKGPDHALQEHASATGASSDASDLSHTDLSKLARMITRVPRQSKSRLHMILQP